MKYIHIHPRQRGHFLWPVCWALTLFFGTSALFLSAQPTELALFDATYSGPKAFTATQSIAVGPNIRVASGGDVTLGAPEVFLLKGVYVQNGGALHIVSGTLAVSKDPQSIAEGLQLQYYPNPVRQSTQVSYHLSTSEMVEIGIFDHHGRQIRQLFAGARTTGAHRHLWDGRNTQGQLVAAGLYYLRFVAGDLHISRQLLVLR